MTAKILYDYALSFLGTPYLWAGDDPLKGIDCSGLAIELLKSQGVLPLKYDNTAQGLFQDLQAKGHAKVAVFDFGALVFFGKPGALTHVGFALSNKLMLEAGGGDSTVTSLQAAADKNAFVRIRPVAARGDYVAAIQPKYGWG